MLSRFDRYLGQLEGLTGGVRPIVHAIEPHLSDLEPLAALIYRDLPSPNCLTGITYGLSLSDHPDWQGDRWELCITVRPADTYWGLRLARMAEVLRGRCSFRYGLPIWKWDNEKTMSGFVVAEPAFLAGQQNYLAIDVSPANGEGTHRHHQTGWLLPHSQDRDGPHHQQRDRGVLGS